MTDLSATSLCIKGHDSRSLTVRLDIQGSAVAGYVAVLDPRHDRLLDIELPNLEAIKVLADTLASCYQAAVGQQPLKVDKQ